MLRRRKVAERAKMNDHQALVVSDMLVLNIDVVLLLANIHSHAKQGPLEL
jgi:hypothetical protein